MGAVCFAKIFATHKAVAGSSKKTQRRKCFVILLVPKLELIDYGNADDIFNKEMVLHSFNDPTW